MGEGNWQEYGMRMYNPRIGRFPNVDPITKKYPELTPYQFASNTPIWAIDLDGLECYFMSPPGDINAEGASMLVDFAPGFGDIKGGIESLIGKDILGNDLSPAQRLLGIFGLTEIKNFTKITRAVNVVAKVSEPFLTNFNKIIEIADEVKEVSQLESVVVHGARDTDKFIVIGRAQNKRVNVFGKVLKDRGLNVETITDEIPSAEITFEKNQNWIQQKIKDGYGVIDIGLDPEYTKTGNFDTGDFYKMELENVQNANFGAKGTINLPENP